MKKTVRKLTVLVMMIVIGMFAVACKKEESGASIRVGSLKGPTSIGLVELMERAENKETVNEYSFVKNIKVRVNIIIRLLYIKKNNQFTKRHSEELQQKFRHHSL